MIQSPGPRLRKFKGSHCRLSSFKSFKFSEFCKLLRQKALVGMIPNQPTNDQPPSQPANPTHEPNKYRSKPPNLVPEISTIFLKNGISNLLVVAQYEVIWLANKPCYLSPSYAGDTV